MRVLLISTYDLGRQPFGLASPAAWLRRTGAEVECVDTSRDKLSDASIRRAELVALYLPMHTATRLATRVLQRVRMSNPGARLAAFGLYAPLNAEWLRAQGVTHVLGPEAEAALVRLANGQASSPDWQTTEMHETDGGAPPPIPKLQFIQPDRSALPSLTRYAALQMPDGSRRVVGSTDATRGCKHLCRHCPIVPVYRGAFRVVPVDVVLNDVRALVTAGAQHISFGDPDFFNGPTHARRVVEQLACEFPSVSYDVTIKIQHVLRHRDLLQLLRDTGCLFVTSAVESIDPYVLRALRKGHTREDFVDALSICRAAGVRLSPTFVPFTPWTTIGGYIELLEQLAALGLQDDVAPIQLAIRLLVTADSALLELADMRNRVDPFDPASLTWPWRHADRAVDDLQREVMGVVESMPTAPRRAVFDTIAARAYERAGLARRVASPTVTSGPPPPHLTEAWYCCAEPTADIRDYV